MLPFVTAAFCAALPAVAGAAVSITEIMYDPKDTDTASGGEWVEIYNSGPAVVDFSSWIFFEADTNHGVTADTSLSIPAGGYAVISKDTTVFRNFFAGYQGLLFKASFSLNDGETLALKENREGAPIDTVTYTSEWGAKNDGNSLQKNGTVWIPAAATPGATNASQAALPQGSSTSPVAGGGTQSAPASVNAPGGSFEPLVPRLFADAGSDRSAIAGGVVRFEGHGFGEKHEPLSAARYIWNFGDGSTYVGQNVLHSYKTPGRYIVSLSVASGDISVTDVLTVTVTASPLSVGKVVPGESGSIEVANSASEAVDISGWILQAGAKQFALPAGTFLSGRSSVVFDAVVTGLSPTTDVDAVLRYPSGAQASVAALLVEEKKPVVRAVTAQPVSTPSPKPKSVPVPATPPVRTVVSHVPVMADGTGSSTGGPALISSSGTEKGTAATMWYAALAGVLFVGAAGVLALERKRPVDEIDIIE